MKLLTNPALPAAPIFMICSTKHMAVRLWNIEGEGGEAEDFAWIVENSPMKENE